MITKYITRSDYMNRRVTHREYYAAVLESAGIKLDKDSSIVKEVLNSTDEHYNDIPLSRWDMMAAACRPALDRAFAEHGDFFSMAGGVCAMKEAARQAVEA